MARTQGLETTFNTVCAEYDRWRPGYVRELYDDIFAAKEINRSSHVLEIGIGTGQATLPILEKGCALTAVELGGSLAEYARRKFRDYETLKVINTAFQDYECPAGSFDLIYSASAFHWIPEGIGYTKVLNLLKSGGVFARFANHPYRDKEREDLHIAMEEIYAEYMPGSSKVGEYGEADAEKLADISRKYGFADVRYTLYHRTRTFTAVEYTALLGTYSDHIALAEQKRAALFDEIQGVIREYGDQITVCDTVDLQLARKP